MDYKKDLLDILQHSRIAQPQDAIDNNFYFISLYIEWLLILCGLWLCVLLVLYWLYYILFI